MFFTVFIQFFTKISPYYIIFINFAKNIYIVNYRKVNV